MIDEDFDAEPVKPIGEKRFCPRCRKITPDESLLCPSCGETAIAQGFCAVCDRLWTLAVGADCPKHDLPLEPRPQPRTKGDEFVDWVRIETYPLPIAAQAGRIRLEAEGIPTFLEGEHMGAHGLYSVAIGGVRLLVPRHMEHEARVLLSQTWTPPAELDDDLDDAWESLAPEPGFRRRAVMKAVIVIILAIPALRALFAFVTG